MTQKFLTEKEVNWIVSKEGVSTLYSQRHNDTYHSHHGAVQESQHIFIHSGLNEMPGSQRPIVILEVGLGTGLNATLVALLDNPRRIRYIALEPEPLIHGFCDEWPYAQEYSDPQRMNKFMNQIHQSEWNVWQSLTPRFELLKLNQTLQNFTLLSEEGCDCVFFDAFAPSVQPELWTKEVFLKLYKLCRPGAVLVTYSVKGDVRRALQSVGFKVEKIPGPHGKRHCLRARKE